MSVLCSSNDQEFNVEISTNPKDLAGPAETSVNAGVEANAVAATKATTSSFWNWRSKQPIRIKFTTLYNKTIALMRAKKKYCERYLEGTDCSRWRTELNREKALPEINPSDKNPQINMLTNIDNLESNLINAISLLDIAAIDYLLEDYKYKHGRVHSEYKRVGPTQIEHDMFREKFEALDQIHNALDTAKVLLKKPSNGGGKTTRPKHLNPARNHSGDRMWVAKRGRRTNKNKRMSRKYKKRSTAVKRVVANIKPQTHYKKRSHSRELSIFFKK